MMLDPTAITPSAGASPQSPFASPVQSITRPKPYACLAGTTPTKVGWSPNAFQSEMLLIHSNNLTGAKPGDVLFFGDSITQMLPAARVTPFAMNFGMSGQTPEGVLQKLDEYAPALNQAGAVSLMIGTNSLRTDSPSIANIQDYIMRIINWLTGPLVWTEIIYTGSPQPDYNANIATVNSYIRAQIGARAKTAIVNINPTVAAGGSLLPAYSADGLHLNGRGHDVWVEAIRAALKSVT
jgi:hypothetical protein